MKNNILDKKYNPKEIENDIYQLWVNNKLYLTPKKGKPFSMILPPPNVTGVLHLGHAWDSSIQDTIIRFKRLQGYRTLWVPGTDHAGIATQTKFEKFLEKYKPEENNMFFVTTKGKHVYSDPNYKEMTEVFALFGKETKGLPEDILLKYIDKTIRIPMRPTLRSLNLANSVAIVAYDIVRQQEFVGLEEISKYFDK